MTRRRFSILFAACAVAAACCLVPRAAADPGASREYQVKAAFLYNFAQFVEWPDDAFKGPHPGERAIRAKGVVCRGVFTPDPGAASLSAAAHLRACGPCNEDLEGLLQAARDMEAWRADHDKAAQGDDDLGAQR